MGATTKYVAPLLNTLRCHCNEFNLAGCHDREFHGVKKRKESALAGMIRFAKDD